MKVEILTKENLLKHQDELKKQFGATANIAYANVSRTQLSIARHYGGCKVQGHNFVYNPAEDILIREDVAKWLAKKCLPKTRKTRK